MNHTINSKNLDSIFHRLSKTGIALLWGLTTSFLLLVGGCGKKSDTDSLLEEFTFDVPIAYITRPVDALVTFVDGDNGNANPRNAFQYKPGPTAEGGGNLYVREFASTSAKEYNITASPRDSWV